MKIYRIANFDYSDSESKFVKMIQTPDLDSDTVAYLVQCYNLLTFNDSVYPDGGLDEEFKTEIIQHLTMDGMDTKDIVRELNRMKQYVNEISPDRASKSYPSTLGTTNETETINIGEKP